MSTREEDIPASIRLRLPSIALENIRANRRRTENLIRAARPEPAERTLVVVGLHL